MRIGMIGTGYVGLVSGTCFAEFGFHVSCADKDETKIEQLKKGKIPIFEPQLESLVERQLKADRLEFTTDIKQVVENSDAVFIAVGTPSRREDGDVNLDYVYGAAREIAQYINKYTVIITKSTVPIGTAREIKRIILEENPQADFDVASNPEFLREGAAINDFMRPDRVLIGAESERACEVLRSIYRPLFLNQTPIVFVSLETAELAKYASNAFLATKITFINEIANLCEATGANVQDVARAMGYDGRIGSKFLHAGPGYGGSCFPKDTLALVQMGEKYNTPQTIVSQVVQVNKNRFIEMADKIILACGSDVMNKKIGILGISFKPNTDDVRDAPSLTIIPYLQERGAIIKAHDPEAIEQAKKCLVNIHWCKDAYDVAVDCDALVILTEWNEYRALDLKRLSQSMKIKTLLDLRNIYKDSDIEGVIENYISVGRFKRL